MSTEPDPTDPATECKLILPFTTICKVFAAILFALAAYKLWTLFLLLFLALLVAHSWRMFQKKTWFCIAFTLGCFRKFTS